MRTHRAASTVRAFPGGGVALRLPPHSMAPLQFPAWLPGDAGSRITAPGCPTERVGCPLPSPGPSMRPAGCPTNGAGCSLRKMGGRPLPSMDDPAAGMEHPGSRMDDPAPSMDHPGRRMDDPAANGGGIAGPNGPILPWKARAGARITPLETGNRTVLAAGKVIAGLGTDAREETPRGSAPLVLTTAF